MPLKPIKARLPIVNIGDARIFFRNFSGKPGRYNRKGDRSFCVHLDNPKMAKELASQGWNVKMTKPRHEEDSPEPYIQVRVSYAKFPPKIAIIKGRKEPVYLDEHGIDILDWADLASIDLVLNPSSWTTLDGKSGVSAYLKAGYFTIIEDAFEAKYQNPADTGKDDEYKEID